MPLRLSASHKYFNIFMNLCSLFLIGDNNFHLIYWNVEGINIYEKKFNGEIPYDAESF